MRRFESLLNVTVQAARFQKLMVPNLLVFGGHLENHALDAVVTSDDNLKRLPFSIHLFGLIQSCYYPHLSLVGGLR